MQLHEMFVRVAKERAGKLAFVDRGTNSRVTYKAALVRSLILAEKFKKYEPGFLGVMIPTSAGCAYTILAALLSGRTPVLINYSTGAAENCRIAQRRLDFRTIITSRALLERTRTPKIDGMVFLEDLAASVSSLEKLRGAMRATGSPERVLKAFHTGSDDEYSVVLFTSGSEKDPKAVPLSHRNINANLDGFSQVLDLTADDILLANLPFFHVFGLTVNLWTPIRFGMTIVTCPNPLEYRAICRAIREERVTMMVGTPTFLQGYLQKSEQGDFQTIRLMISGADKCPESLRRAYWERHRITVYEGYGTTETSPVISVNTPANNRPGSVGKALPNVQVRMEHYETGEECGVNEIGRILVRGDSVMSGYFDDFEATSLHMRHGWYDTGDMGYMDEDGYLWHVGRIRRFLKIGGEMVSLVRVEDALQRALPDDVECSVVEIPDALRGSRIVAAVTRPIDEDAAIEALSRELPNFALPKRFVVIPELPKMTSGKIDFRAITEIVQDIVQRRSAAPA